MQWLLVGISALSSRMICLDFMVLRSENWPALRASEEVLAATIYGEALYSMVPITSMTAQSLGLGDDTRCQCCSYVVQCADASQQKHTTNKHE